MTNQPVLQALVLADQVYRDADTGKMIIAGTFRQLWARKFGETLGRWTYAYICLTELNGTAKLELRYVNLKTMEVHLKTGIEVSCDDPLSTIEFALPVPPLPMPCWSHSMWESTARPARTQTAPGWTFGATM